jgi:uncharacterized protein VirK/YbjX
LIYLGYGRLGRFALRVAKVGRAMWSPGRHARLASAMRNSQRQGVYLHRDSSFWKYLDLYLARGLSVRARAGIIEHHYRFLDGRLAQGVTRSAWINGAPFWSNAAESGRRYTLTAGQAVRAPREGEGEIAMLVNGAALMTLTFTIAPGAPFGLPDAHVLAVGGMQGVPGKREDIRIAAKDHGEVAPAAMLLLAAKALAEEFAIDHVIGVSDAAHIEQGRLGLTLKISYDRLWSEAGAAALPNGMFLLNVTEREARSLAHLSSAHRARARRKGALKARLHEAMSAGLGDVFALDAATPTVKASARSQRNASIRQQGQAAC